MIFYRLHLHYSFSNDIAIFEIAYLVYDTTIFSFSKLL